MSSGVLYGVVPLYVCVCACACVCVCVCVCVCMSLSLSFSLSLSLSLSLCGCACASVCVYARAVYNAAGVIMYSKVDTWLRKSIVSPDGLPFVLNGTPP